MQFKLHASVISQTAQPGPGHFFDRRPLLQGNNVPPSKIGEFVLLQVIHQGI